MHTPASHRPVFRRTPWLFHVDTVRPSTRIVIISLVVALIAIVAHLARIPVLTQYHFWITILAYAVRLAGTLYREL